MCLASPIRIAAGICMAASAILASAACHPELESAPLSTPIASPHGDTDRPLALLDQLRPGALRDRLERCRHDPLIPSSFSIGHRGAPRHYPEHTRESYLAAARMGAGAIECDVTFTKDHHLVCRHSQCDLATTTTILETPLASKCEVPFRPARFDSATGERESAAEARCCTSDLTLAELRGLEGRRDARDEDARSIEAFLQATPDGDRASIARRGTLVTHAESIALFTSLGVAMVPELKAPLVSMPHRDPETDTPMTQAQYATKLVEAYRSAGIPPARVTLQSFSRQDIELWLRVAPAYGARAVWLVDPDRDAAPPPAAEFDAYHASGIRRLGVPIGRLLTLDEEGEIVASPYAQRARMAGLELIAWTFERSGVIRDGRVGGRSDDFYLGPIVPALDNEGDLFRVLHALHAQVGVRAVFSDWPATTTYYANCMGLE